MCGSAVAQGCWYHCTGADSQLLGSPASGYPAPHCLHWSRQRCTAPQRSLQRQASRQAGMHAIQECRQTVSGILWATCRRRDEESSELSFDKSCSTCLDYGAGTCVMQHAISAHRAGHIQPHPAAAAPDSPEAAEGAVQSPNAADKLAITAAGTGTWL